MKEIPITVPKAGDTFMLGNAKVQVLMPKEQAPCSANTSIVLRVTYGRYSFLFMGDSEQMDEDVLLTSSTSIRSTVIKIGHHGSGSSTFSPLLHAVRPQYAVISVGSKNDHGHPDKRVLQLLKDSGVILFRTDMQGTITFLSNGSELHVLTQKNAEANTYIYQGGYGNSIKYVFNPTAAPVNTRPIPPPAAKTGEPVTYIVNVNPKAKEPKFHKAGYSCAESIKPANRLACSCSWQELQSRGYTPCKKCCPCEP